MSTSSEACGSAISILIQVGNRRREIVSNNNSWIRFLHISSITSWAGPSKLFKANVTLTGNRTNRIITLCLRRGSALRALVAGFDQPP
ncbi:hypothetical protein ACROYT_G017983 [Oculina patagonica]